MTKRAAVINDLSSFGRCSLTAAIAVLSAMGHQPCPLPTAVLSAQSEFPVFAAKDLTSLMPRYADAWKQNGERFDGIATGYFAQGEQLSHTLRFIEAFKTDGVLLLVDPVMGDNGRLYPGYDRAACRQMKTLAELADVLTPNLTELCLLTNTDYASLTAHSSEDDYLERIADLAYPLSNKRGVIVTGIPMADEIVTLTLSGGKSEALRTKRVRESFSGTGDIFSAVVFGCLLSGLSLTKAAQTAVHFVKQAIDDTIQQPHDPLYGVNFEQYLHRLNEVTTYANR